MRDFFGCYLLTSLNPKNKGRTYIGFTVNPQRRIRQHNGEIVSGAHKTKRHRPWEMVLVVYGFSTQVQALQFEWAWQHPLKSKAVRAVAESLGTRKMAGTKGKVALLMDMLNLAPWCHFPLTVQVLSSSYSGLRAAAKQPPAHMRVEVAPLEALPARVDDGLDEDAEREDELDNGNSSGSGEDDSSLTVLDVSAQPAAISNKCALCSRCADATWLACTCGCRTHTECLAQHFLAASGNGSRLPSSGACPACAKQWAWVDMLARSENKGWQQSRRGRAAKTSKAPAKPAKAAIATGSTAVELDADSAEAGVIHFAIRKSGGIPSLRPIKTSSGGVGCFDLSLPRAAVTDTGPAAHQEQHNQHPLINGMGSGRFGADDWEGTPVGAVPDALVCSSPECAASPMPLRRRLQQRLASSCLGAENGVICLLE
ncbi:hypothetical protein WJX72_003481 [[Myrmecia] bisecta]|uniref:Structure-specific endonuclease subunit SLX1 homolog n=1 Tax=[Myrmecia] bisecta TaxID=41462 RepID=A0AAW1R671_9CHLO